MILNFKKPLLNLDGTETQEYLNTLLANVLATASEVADPVKYFDWSIKIFNDGEVDLDTSDTENLKSFIKTNKRLNVFTQGRLLEIFSEAAAMKIVEKEKEKAKV